MINTVQPSSIARIVLGYYGRTIREWKVQWRNNEYTYDHQILGRKHGFKTSDDAIAFAKLHGFGAYHLNGKTIKLRSP